MILSSRSIDLNMTGDYTFIVHEVLSAWWCWSIVVLFFLVFRWRPSVSPVRPARRGVDRSQSYARQYPCGCYRTERSKKSETHPCSRPRNGRLSIRWWRGKSVRSWYILCAYGSESCLRRTSGAGQPLYSMSISSVGIQWARWAMLESSVHRWKDTRQDKFKTGAHLYTDAVEWRSWTFLDPVSSWMKITTISRCVCEKLRHSEDAK